MILLKLKSYKQLFIGMLIGSLAFGAIPALAKSIDVKINEATITINGKKATMSNLVYNKVVYVSLEEVSKLLGKETVLNAKKNTIDIRDKAKSKFYSEYNKDIPDFSVVTGVPQGRRIALSDKKTVMYKYDVTDATPKNLDKYIAALEAQGYVFEEDTSDDEILYYSKGKIVVGITIMEYDFSILITKDD